MDNGEVIPGLNEDWTFAGCKAMEWAAGFVMMLVFSELFFTKPAKQMPYLMTVWMMTTLTLASVRRQFPDEERGLRNYLMTALGFCPPYIPAPARLQPLWSGAPMRKMDEKNKLVSLGLDKVLDQKLHGEEDDGAVSEERE